jgi:hypothetical protein
MRSIFKDHGYIDCLVAIYSIPEFYLKLWCCCLATFRGHALIIRIQLELNCLSADFLFMFGRKVFD